MRISMCMRTLAAALLVCQQSKLSAVGILGVTMAQLWGGGRKGLRGAGWCGREQEAWRAQDQCLLWNSNHPCPRDIPGRNPFTPKPILFSTHRQVLRGQIGRRATNESTTLQREHWLAKQDGWASYMLDPVDLNYGVERGIYPYLFAPMPGVTSTPCGKVVDGLPLDAKSG